MSFPQSARCCSGIALATIHSRRSGTSLPPGFWSSQNAPAERFCENCNACFLGAISPRISGRCSEDFVRIRARLHATVVVCWQQNETHTHVPDPAFAQLSEPQTRKTDYPAEAMLPLPAQRPSQSQTPDPFMPQGALEEEHMAPQKTAPHPEGQPAPLTSVASFEQCSSFYPSAMRPKSRRRRSSLTMEQAIHAYLEAQRKGKRRPKTWSGTRRLCISSSSICTRRADACSSRR